MNSDAKSAWEFLRDLTHDTGGMHLVVIAGVLAFNVAANVAVVSAVGLSGWPKTVVVAGGLLLAVGLGGLAFGNERVQRWLTGGRRGSHD